MSARRNLRCGLSFPSFLFPRSLSGTQYTADQLNFTHGIASGDPYSNSVILWTRVAPMMNDVNSNVTVSGYVPLYNHGSVQNASTAPICVQFKVAKTADFAHVESSGTAYTSSDVDYTIKVEAANLTAFTRYYYQFNICNSNKTSPLGRTKTTPNVNDYTSKVALAIYSCSNFRMSHQSTLGGKRCADVTCSSIRLLQLLWQSCAKGFCRLRCPLGRLYL